MSGAGLEHERHGVWVPAFAGTTLYTVALFSALSIILPNDSS